MAEIEPNDFQFFPASNFNNLSFYLYCPNLKNEEKEKLKEIIIQNKGVRQNINNYILFARIVFSHLHPKQ